MNYSENNVAKTNKIMITGINGFSDNGEVALLIGAIENIKNAVPDSHFYMGSIFDNDKTRLRQVFPYCHEQIELVEPIFKNIKIIPWYLNVAFLLIKYPFLYSKADIVIHLGADGYSDQSTGGPLSTLTHSYQLFLGYIFRKPVILCAVTVGPFNFSWSRKLVKFVLDRVSFITPRESVTLNYLNELEVKSPMSLVSDLAFLMNPASKKRVDFILNEKGLLNGKPLACLVPSDIIYKKISGSQNEKTKHEIYIKAMADVIDYLTNKGFEVILIPQVVHGKHDDVKIIQKIYNKTKQKPTLIDKGLTPQEIKGVLGRCSILVSSKMHSAILATSMGTPTVIIAYGSKVHGIIGSMLKQEDYIIDLRGADISILEGYLHDKIEKCLLDQDKIHNELLKCIPEIKEMSLRNIEIIKKIFYSIS
ncbi:MAG TPA: hypothetical protein DCK87_02325 [Desulfotomaculum sp.]|nr:hypothetical protein [Desulfotomaculum sp.]